MTREYGTTYWWGAMLLPRAQRRQVHAVYALCRLADDIVDAPQATTGAHAAGTGQALHAFADRFTAAVEVARRGGLVEDPVMAAIADTVRASGIERECFDRFFGAMAMDLTTTRYETFDDLVGYMEGSAAVIGEMMLPVLRPLRPEAREPARSLGFAFQLTNFLRDVGEDLDRGRVYVPQADLRRFDADPWLRRVTPQWRALLAFEIERNRELYARADPGIAMLPPASARCVATARVLYSRILDRIERCDYDVFSARVRVPRPEKAWVAAATVVNPRRVPRTEVAA
nr:phytoene/squalene synthase family protein [Auraticoccus cholistanensis]